MWTPCYGPFDTGKLPPRADDARHGSDPLFYAIVDQATNRAAGVVSYIGRFAPRTIEVGHIAFSPLLQRTPARPRQCL